MQKCPKCDKEIKYIATGYNTVVVCETELITLVTERGNKTKGYLPHVCKRGKSEVKKQNG